MGESREKNLPNATVSRLSQGKEKPKKKKISRYLPLLSKSVSGKMCPNEGVNKLQFSSGQQDLGGGPYGK